MPGMDEFLPRLRELQVANETSEWPLRLFHATAILLRRSRFLRYDHTQQDLSLLLWADCVEKLVVFGPLMLVITLISFGWS
ncbi:hypothetical protein LY10_04151 [Planktotalea frisia]|uniref:Uncharacterized protein n=3 Tax=Planktotalea frisia TaxID=696762 RepID=A0A1L9P0N3_9RHOB|nr:hypothetical protein PFRI_07010 [Planktotalea frisia]PZX18698.1 hypothetical protein LY10_04151 [Planktotalea frisia]